MSDAKTIEDISDLIPDPRNANLGTERGLRMLDDSLREDGAGRSILVDRDGVTIAGAKHPPIALAGGRGAHFQLPGTGNVNDSPQG